MQVLRRRPTIQIDIKSVFFGKVYYLSLREGHVFILIK